MAAEYVQRMGLRIKERREELGLSQVDIARALPGKVDGSQVSRWERGLHKPGDDTLERLGEILSVPVTWFMAPAPDKHETPTPFPSDGAATQLDRIERLLQTGVDRLEQIGEERRCQQEEILGRIEALEKALIQQAEAQTTKAIAAAVKRIAAEYAARQAPAAGPEEAAPVAQGSSRRRSRQARSQGTSSAR